MSLLSRTPSHPLSPFIKILQKLVQTPFPCWSFLTIPTLHHLFCSIHLELTIHSPTLKICSI
jgi:hypothetical protein